MRCVVELDDGCGGVRCVVELDDYTFTDMPPGTDCPYPIRILAFFEMIRPYHVVIRI